MSSDSENRNRLSANIDDIIAAFDIPKLMFCEASYLFRLPSFHLDPVSERVNLNSQFKVTVYSSDPPLHVTTGSIYACKKI